MIYIYSTFMYLPAIYDHKKVDLMYYFDRRIRIVEIRLKYVLFLFKTFLKLCANAVDR